MSEIVSNLYPYWVVLLLVTFVGIVVWVYWPSRRRKQQMRDHADIPFRNDPDEDRRR